jgi:hypothetical protein
MWWRSTEILRHRHAVHFDIDDVFIGSDMLSDLTVDITRYVIGWRV